MKIALLAGTQSGCGKTTIMLALLQYLKQRKHRVLAFKAGPDFLDPLWHQAITEQSSYNLDTRMIGLDISRQLINSQANQAEIALIEGVMGLFDGRTGVGEEGSSADLAKALNCPVILVINAKGISGSIVPLVGGFCHYAEKMGVKIAGIIANHVGSPHHAKLLTQFLQDYGMPPLVAWMEKQAPVLAERHLGLVMPEQINIADFQAFFHVDIDVLSTVFSNWRKLDEVTNSFVPLLAGKRIAIAKDEVCCFIYQANIDWLIEQGAELFYFSVINGEDVPVNATALWLPGGYPELYTELLSSSKSWSSIRRFIESDKPVLAECGGAMLLGQMLIDIKGKAWAMANILPYRSIMQKKLAALGYREDASGMKGHEFHYSIRTSETAIETCFECSRGDKGVRYKNLRASYIHWYFASAPEVMLEWLG
ncbi:MAG: cobyrinate a,c-diamide synthase [Methylococcales symbiont of Iophon sp. n. MRB-2018]|nr:MAG: cobyrinate a,c-diamide synthase [Methylococcales symbiont of Iophon sp. n. MRB-2018]KAF3979316.1 MAG: cobyrinate a,c-diamide synthase [Methylococcales symbiont of Iophon sp. n. MRB-2018]